jgi:hypothetical protein
LKCVVVYYGVVCFETIIMFCVVSSNNKFVYSFIWSLCCFSVQSSWKVYWCAVRVGGYIIEKFSLRFLAYNLTVQEIGTTLWGSFCNSDLLIMDLVWITIYSNLFLWFFLHLFVTAYYPVNKSMSTHMNRHVLLAVLYIFNCWWP